MSAAQGVPTGAPYVVRATATILAANAGIGGRTKFTFRDTGTTLLELLRANRIQWMILRGLPANQTADVELQRGGRKVRDWPSDLLLSSREGPFFPGFPTNVGAGTIQLEAIATTAITADTELTLDVIFAAAPETVVS